jgi:FXSXX-COOH protein
MPMSPPSPPSPRDLPGLEELPDLEQLSLEELRTVRHPVLDEVLAELSSRIDEPTEMLWGFNNFV